MYGRGSPDGDGTSGVTSIATQDADFQSLSVDACANTAVMALNATLLSTGCSYSEGKRGAAISLKRLAGKVGWSSGADGLPEEVGEARGRRSSGRQIPRAGRVVVVTEGMENPTRHESAKFGLRKTRASAPGSSAKPVEKFPAPGGERRRSQRRRRSRSPPCSLWRGGTSPRRQAETIRRVRC